MELCFLDISDVIIGIVIRQVFTFNICYYNNYYYWYFRFHLYQAKFWVLWLLSLVEKQT